MTVSAGDAHQWPIYNARFRVVFPILDADGDPVAGATGLDSEASQDQGTFTDCTNEATQIATSSGVYYLDLIATELDTKCTAVIVKSTEGKTTVLTLYPKRMPVIRTGTAQAGGASTITLDGSASATDDFYTGCYVNITNDSPAGALGQARRITDYVGSTKVATVEAAWGTNPSSASTFEILLPGDIGGVAAWAGTAPPDPHTAGYPIATIKDGTGTGEIDTASGKVLLQDGAITASVVATAAIDADALAADTITAAKVAADVGAEVAAAVWNEDATGHQTQGTFGQAIGDPGVDADTLLGRTDSIDSRLPAALVAGMMNSIIGAAAANSINATSLTADVATELRSVAFGTSDSGSTTTMVDAARTEADTDYWKGCFILFTSGTIAGQVRLITAFDPATDTITFAPATTQAVSTQTYEILPTGRSDVELWDGSAVNGLASGRVDTSVGAMAAGVVTAAAVATDAIDGDALAPSALTEIKTQVTDALNVDTYAEPGQATPPATATLVQKIGFLFKAWRNRTTQTSSQYKLYGDDAATVDQKASFSDDATTADRGEVATGP